MLHTREKKDLENKTNQSLFSNLNEKPLVKALVSNFYFYQDARGSTSHIASASGALLESYRYDLYGTPSYFNSTSQPLTASTYNITDLYVGERWAPELGLYDLRNRFMSPELGRFLQADPIGLQNAGAKPSARAVALFPAGQAPGMFAESELNLYRYCHNDPVNKNDPFGLEPPPDEFLPLPVLKLGIQIALKSYRISIAAQDGMERGKLGVADNQTGALSEAPGTGTGVGTPFSGPQTIPDMPRAPAGTHAVIDGHNHTNRTSMKNSPSDHKAKIPRAMTKDGRTFEVYKPGKSGKEGETVFVDRKGDLIKEK